MKQFIDQILDLPLNKAKIFIGDFNDKNILMKAMEVLKEDKVLYPLLSKRISELEI